MQITFSFNGNHFSLHCVGIFEKKSTTALFISVLSPRVCHFFSFFFCFLASFLPNFPKKQSVFCFIHPIMKSIGRATEKATCICLKKLHFELSFIFFKSYHLHLNLNCVHMSMSFWTLVICQQDGYVPVGSWLLILKSLLFHVVDRRVNSICYKLLFLHWWSE